MKRVICTVLASLMFLSAAACGKISPDTANSATASAAEQILTDRLGEIPENVVLGDAAVAAEYGIDMTDFEDDGYILRTVGGMTLVFGKAEDGLDLAVRAYVKAVEAGTADTLDVTYHEGYRIERLTIAGRDISEYTVYYPETANENMKFAADELVRLVEIATGVRLPVVVGAPVSPAIELRHTDDPALETDGYRYEVTETRLVIEGAVKRGCMNGVWRFIQLEMGWDFLIYGNSYLNEADHIDIPVGTARTEDPAFEFLNLPNAFENFKNDCKVPNIVQNSYGTLYTAGHELSNYYVGADTSRQPCYTDEDFYEETLKNIETYVAANYGNPNFKYVNIGQNDSTDYCICTACMKVLAEEGSNSGAVIRYANRVSEEINKSYPGLPFLIFAYAGSNTPPKVTVPNEHLYITFCFDWNCTNHKMDGSDCKDTVYFYGRNNSTYADWIEGWCSITPNMYLYVYNNGIGLDDYTIVNNIYDDYRYFHELGVKGINLEGGAYGNFAIKRIEQMLIKELNWNTDMTRDEFTEIYHTILRYEYGDSWEIILDYINEWEMSQDLANCWSWWGKDPWLQTSRFFDTGFFAARFDNYVEMFDKAVLMANSAEQEEMILRLSVSMLYKGCYASYFLAYLDNDEERLQILSDRYDRCMNTLIELGEDPTNLIGYWVGSVRHYSLNIEEAAWTNENHKWVEYFYILTGQELPEDAPIVKE